MQTSADVVTARPVSAQPLERDELSAWLRLASAPQIGPVRMRRLLSRFGLPVNVLQAEFAAIEPLVGAATAQFLCAPALPAVEREVDRVRAWLDAPSHHLVVLGDPAYPPALLESHDPPPMLYVRGRLELLHPGPAGQPAVAVVGSRRASHAGKLHAARFARVLGEAHVTVVSGLAMGIDAVAHESALETSGGTVAVVGTGADRAYPRANEDLYERIATDGAIVSEWPLGTAPRPAHFPRRNRVIAALSAGVLVVEATPHSGSLITAHLAADYGRDVYAIPGSIEAPYKRGCNRLIQEGAMLVESPTDLLAALGLACPEREASARRKAGSLRREHAAQPEDDPLSAVVSAWVSPSDEGSDTQFARPRCHLPADASSCSPSLPAPATCERAVLSALGHDPAPLDVIAARTGLAGEQIQAAVLALELEGQVEWLSGGRLARITP